MTFLGRMQRGEEVRELEVRRKKEDASWVDLELSAAPLRGTDSSIVGTIAVFADITTRKGAEWRYAIKHRMTA